MSKEKKITIREELYEELKAYSEYSGVPMAKIVFRLWEKSNERKKLKKRVGDEQ